MKISIALVGDYNKKVDAHIAIPHALEQLCSALKIDLSWSWLETTAIDSKDILKEFDGIWVTPGSPYQNMEGALTAIKFARETHRPFLGTCGGFQHALIEYARNVLHSFEADHAESNPQAKTLIVTPLSCSLVNKEQIIHFIHGSQLDTIFKGKESKEAYQCNYGLNPDWQSRLQDAGLHFTGLDDDKQARAFELPKHPFFIGTLFQPELATRKGKQHPIITAYVETLRNLNKVSSMLDIMP